jgi:hypothetical protein
MLSKFIYSKFIIDSRFYEVIDDLGKKNIHADSPINISIDKGDYFPNSSDVKIQAIEQNEKFKLDLNRGQEITNEYIICAYDESLVKIPALEGSGFFISHSLITLGKDSYVPLIFLTFNFYTRSRSIADGNNSLIFTTKPLDLASKIKYLEDRMETLSRYTPASSILLIDGPLIGGQITDFNMKLNAELLKKNIFPIYFVKNSDSSLIIDNSPSLKEKYNSDFEWAYKTLNPGERTRLYKYSDLSDPIGNKKKFFSYVKAFSAPPCRVEFDETAYLAFGKIIDEIFHMVFYLLFAQGNPLNPQARPIAIAETFAREALKVIDFEEVIHRAGITTTMNYTRFGW